MISRKAASFDEITPDVWKISKFDDDYTTLCINKIQERNEQNDTSTPSPSKVTSGSIKIILAYHLMLELITFIVSCISIQPEVEKITWENQNSFRRN